MTQLGLPIAEPSGYFEGRDEHGCLIVRAYASQDTRDWFNRGLIMKFIEGKLPTGADLEDVGCKVSPA